MSCDITAVGPLGLCQVTVSADADMGTGVTTITGVLDVQIIAGACQSRSQAIWTCCD